MRILPTYTNIQWNQEYNNIPFFPDKTIDKTLWLLDKYCNGKTDFNDVPELGKFFNITSTTDASFTVSLNEINKISGYEDFTIYDLLRVNYIITDEKQFFFVNTDGVKVDNNRTVTYTLSLDSWMTNIEEVFLADGSQEFYIKRGHYDRFSPIKDDPGAYTFDYSLNNPNWDPLNNQEVPKHMFGAEVFSCIPEGTSNWTSNNIILTKSNDINSVFNDMFWMTLLVPLGTTDSTPPAGVINYTNGTDIYLKSGEKIALPYQLITVPLRGQCGIKATGEADYTKMDIDELFNYYAQTDSEIIGAVVTRGLFPGFNIPHRSIELNMDIGDKTFDIEISNNFIENWVGNNLRKFAALKINDLVGNNVNPSVYGNRYSILKGTTPGWNYLNNWLDSIEWKRITKLPGFQFERIFTPRFTTLSKDGYRNDEYEPYMVSDHMFKITLHGAQEDQILSMQSLGGQLPEYIKTSTFDNGTVTERKDIDVGFYKKRKWIGDNLVESKTNIFPTATSNYQTYLLQNQSQRTSDILGTTLTTLAAFIGGITAIATGGISLGVGVATAAGVNAATSGVRIASKSLDARRQPNQANSSNNNVVSELMADMGNGYDYLTVETVIGAEAKYYYEEVFRKGVMWEYKDSPRLDSRWYFNYWQIEDSESVVDVSNLSPADVSIMKQIFENGVRLWHIRDANQDHNPNQYERENLELSVVEA